MRNFIKSYVKEFKSRNISSFRRMLKLLGIISIPFIYSLLCVTAFWNPILNVGNGEVLIINKENTSLVFQYNSINPDKSKDAKIGVVEDSKGNVLNDSTYNDHLYEDIYSANSTYQLDTLLTDPKSKSDETVKIKFSDIFKETNNDKKLVHWRYVNAWSIFKNILQISEDHNKAGENNDENKTYSLKFTEGTQTFNFKNISYADLSKGDKKINYNKYKTIVTLDKGTTSNLLSIVSMVTINKKLDGDGISTLISKVQQIPKINIEAKYSGNYIYGYYMSSVLRFSSAISARLLPTFFMNLETSILYDKISFRPDNDLHIYNKNNTVEQTIYKNNSYVISDYNSDWGTDKALKDQIQEDDTLFGDVNAVTKSKDDKGKETTIARIPQGKFVQIMGFLLNSINPKNYALISDLGIIPGLDKFAGDDKPDLSVLIWLLNDILFDYTHSINPFNDASHKIAVNGKEYSIQDTLKVESIVASILGKDFVNSLKDLNYKILQLNNVYLGNKQIAISADEFTNSVSKMLNSLSISDPTNLLSFITSLISKSIGNSFTFEIGGDSNYEYGLGVGLFFVVIGIFISVFCQTFIYDRGKRVKETGPFAWYYSKSLFMATTSVFEAIFGFIGAVIGGWYILPAGTLFALLGVLLLTAITFTFIIQFIWYLLHDETIARLLVVIVLVLNMASCGGLFPVFMQYKFFEYFSNISIFKYAMHSEGLLIYNLAVTKASSPIINELFINIGAIVLIGLVFALLGLIVAKLRNKDILFGTFLNKKIAKTIEEKKLNYKFVVTVRELKINKINRKIELLKEKIKIIEEQSGEDKVKLLNEKIEALKTKSETIKNSTNKLFDKKAYDTYVLPKVRDEVIYWDIIDKKTETKFKWYKNTYKQETLKTNYTEYDDHEKIDRGE